MFLLLFLLSYTLIGLLVSLEVLLRRSSQILFGAYTCHGFIAN